jgi:hypothetical protein
MIITFKGTQLRGDLILKAVLRYDLAPIPATFEGVIRVDDDLQKSLSEGQVIEVCGDKFYIVKSKTINNRNSQGEHESKASEIIAYLDNVHQTSFVLKKPILKEKVSLQEIYRATGATLKSIANDIKVRKFYCYTGNFPTKDIAATLQCEGGVVRWKNSKMEFLRVIDITKKSPVMQIPDNSLTNLDAGFLERHTVPTYYSTDENGAFIYGNTDKTRSMIFVPDKDVRQLQNMSRVLIQRKTVKLAFDARLCAGDVIDIQGGKPLVIITAAHAFINTPNGGDNYSKLWLGSL